MSTRLESLSECSPRRIALIKPSALGDIVHALPVLSALRARFPEAHITWIVGSRYEELLRGHPHLNATLAFDRNAFREGLLAGFSTFGRLLARLRRERFDLVIDLQGLLRSGVMAIATGAKTRIGLSTAREGARWLYSHLIPVADVDEIHAVDRYWLVVKALGAETGQPRFHLPVSEEARHWALATLNELPRPYLMLGVGARWVTKRWPPRHFAELARRSQGTFGGTVIFVGGGDETTLARAVISELSGPTLDLTGRTTLPQLAGILSLADVTLANDTGPLHLADALGRRVVSPYTCTKVKRTGPYNNMMRAVETRVWCQGSLKKQCDRLECFDELTPDRLWPHLQEVLSQWRANLSA